MDQIHVRMSQLQSHDVLHSSCLPVQELANALGYANSMVEHQQRLVKSQYRLDE